MRFFTNTGCLLIIFVSIMKTSLIFGQYNNHFYFSPYTHNPAYFGSSSEYIFDANYRQNWVGMNDAPQSFIFSSQLPAFTSLNIGINISNHKSILLNENEVLVGAAYNLQFANQQYLNFGLMGGIYMYNYDFSEVENIETDPILLNNMNTRLTPSANFGINYVNGGLTLGVGLTDLFYNEETTSNDLLNNYRFSPFDNFLFSANYNYQISASLFELNPFVLYRYNKNNSFNSQYEMGVLSTYNQLLTMGISYRQNFAISGHLMLTYKEKFDIAYSYDQPIQKETLQHSSHEIKIRIKLKTGKRVERNKSNFSGNGLSPKQQERYKLNGIDIDFKSYHKYSGSMPDFFEIDEGLYLVLNEFKRFKDAESYALEMGINDNIAYSSVSKMFYVYLDKVDDKVGLEGNLEINLEKFSEYYLVEIN